MISPTFTSDEAPWWGLIDLWRNEVSAFQYGNAVLPLGLEIWPGPSFRVKKGEASQRLDRARAHHEGLARRAA